MLPTTLGVASDVRSELYRWMATAGLEWRWPVLFSSTSSTHVLEPMAQVFARPDEQYVASLGIPNEDAQSFVFDASTLFERDKFSGYDRMEGGTRVNVGVRYSGVYGTGWTTNAMLGQSYQVAARTRSPHRIWSMSAPFPAWRRRPPTMSACSASPRRSACRLRSAPGSTSRSLELRRAELKAGLVASPISLTAKYAFIQAQPLYGFPDGPPRSDASADRPSCSTTGACSLRARMISRHNVLTTDSVGFSYDDECFSYTMTYGEARNSTTLETSQTVGFNISFRTIGDFGSNSSTFASQ